MILGLLLVVGLLVGLKAAQIGTLMKAGKQAQKSGPPPEAVSTFVALKQDWEQTLDAVGSVVAGRGVSISNDGAGIVSRIDFESGASVQKGQVLVELDSRVERGQLASARARRRLAGTNARRTKSLVASGALAEAQGDSDQAQLDATAAEVESLAAQIDRKIVRAPFAGKLGIRLVNVGQYLPPGTPISMLESADAAYVDFALPQQELTHIAKGMPVRLTVETGDAGAAPPPVEGSVFAVEPAVDPTTRNIRARATFPDEAEWLRPGMFVNVSVVQPETAAVVAVPGTAVVHASFGDSVFIVEDEKDGAGNVIKGPDGKPSKAVRQQFVRLGPPRGDFVAVAEGVKPGDEVVAAGAFKLRNRARVVVNSAVPVHPELAPHPVNR